MLTGRLRPGYDYLAHRKIGGLLAQAGRSPLAGDVTRFAAGATDLDYGGHVIKRVTERVIIRILIQTGKSLDQLGAADLDHLVAAMRRYGTVKGNRTGWANDRGLVLTGHRVLFHLGVLPAPPEDPRRRPGRAGHYSGVPESLRGVFLAYCAQRAATHARSTVKGTASHLAGFGRFLASLDPPLVDLRELDRATIEAWLSSLAGPRADGTVSSIGHRRGQILTVRQFLTEAAEWGWTSVPTRRLIFTRDLPRLSHPLPRYLPPDADRRLLEALEELSATGSMPLARLHADALLLTRATGLRIGELRDLELDCVHQIDGHGAWLKVPLGKLGTERMIPLDETITVIDRITARRTPGRPLPHPRTGAPTDFLLVHQGRRTSAQALRDELARVCATAGLDKVTPHALRHTFATARFQLRLLPPGADAAARTRLSEHEPALRPPVRHHRARRVRTRPGPDQGTARRRTPARTRHHRHRRAHAAAGRHHRRRRLEGHPHHQVPPGRRVLPARARAGILRLRQHLRALPQLPHRHRLPRRARRAEGRHPEPGRRRRDPRLDRRSHPAPPPPRPARQAHRPSQQPDTMTDIQRVRAACELLLADGRDVTFTAVAEHSGISRATCYRNRDLRAIIETYRARHGDQLTLTGLADRIDNLTQALEAVAGKVRRQEAELRALKQSSGPPPSREARRSPPPEAD